jgi:hypothetical protein
MKNLVLLLSILMQHAKLTNMLFCVFQLLFFGNPMSNSITRWGHRIVPELLCVLCFK